MSLDGQLDEGANELGKLPARCTGMTKEQRRAWCVALERRASLAATTLDKHAALVKRALSSILDAKRVLYEADRNGPGSHCESVLDEASAGMQCVFEEMLPQVLEGQERASDQAQLHAELAACIVAQAGVESAYSDRVALQQQAEKRHEELEALRSDARLAYQAPPPTGPGGLPLEALREVLRAFQTVLQPQLPALLAVPPEERSQSVALSIQYLSNCRDQAAAGSVSSMLPSSPVATTAATSASGPVGASTGGSATPPSQRPEMGGDHEPWLA